jgi:hypothetical protein
MIKLLNDLIIVLEHLSIPRNREWEGNGKDEEGYNNSGKRLVMSRMEFDPRQVSEFFPSLTTSTEILRPTTS